jgi:hypothetical protein
MDAKLRAFWPIFKGDLRRYVDRLQDELSGTRASKLKYSLEPGIVPGSIGPNSIELTLNDYTLSEIKLTFEPEGHLIRVEAKQKATAKSRSESGHSQIDISLTGEILEFQGSDLPVSDKDALLDWCLRSVLGLPTAPNDHS